MAREIYLHVPSDASTDKNLFLVNLGSDSRKDQYRTGGRRQGGSRGKYALPNMLSLQTLGMEYLWGSWEENVEHNSEFSQLRGAAPKGIDFLELSTGQTSKVKKKEKQKNSPQEEPQLFAGSPAHMQKSPLRVYGWALRASVSAIYTKSYEISASG